MSLPFRRLFDVAALPAHFDHRVFHRSIIINIAPPVAFHVCTNHSGRALKVAQHVTPPRQRSTSHPYGFAPPSYQLVMDRRQVPAEAGR